MTEELYLQLVEASMKQASCFALNAILFFILIGLITLMICSGTAYFSKDYCYKSNNKFPKLFYPSTFVTAVLLAVFTYNAQRCSSYPSRRNIDSMIMDLDKIKKINNKTVENN